MNSLLGSYIAIKNNKIVTSKDKKDWSLINGNFKKINNNEWSITYESVNNNFITILYKSGQYTLKSQNDRLYSNDGINWINSIQ